MLAIAIQPFSTLHQVSLSSPSRLGLDPSLIVIFQSYSFREREKAIQRTNTRSNRIEPKDPMNEQRAAVFLSLDQRDPTNEKQTNEGIESYPDPIKQKPVHDVEIRAKQTCSLFGRELQSNL